MLKKLFFEWFGLNSHSMNQDSKNRAVEESQLDVHCLYHSCLQENAHVNHVWHPQGTYMSFVIFLNNTKKLNILKSLVYEQWIHGYELCQSKFTNHNCFRAPLFLGILSKLIIHKMTYIQNGKVELKLQFKKIPAHHLENKTSCL